jgi:hypothetical protein
MENLKIDVMQTTKKSVTLPEYFKTTDSLYFKLVDKETNIRVQYYGEELHLVHLTLFPMVTIGSNYTIHLFIETEIEEITKEEFETVFKKSIQIISTFADI